MHDLLQESYSIAWVSFLAIPSPDDTYSVFTDVIIYGCVDVLKQNDKVIGYCDRTFDRTMTNWTTEQ